MAALVPKGYASAILVVSCGLFSSETRKLGNPLGDSGPNLPTYLGLVFGTFFFDAA